MIDPLNDEVISLSEVARMLPTKTNGKKYHASTIARWITKGCRGVRLEGVRIGNQLCTTRDALAAFLGRCNSGDQETLPDTANRRRARATLKRAGV